MPSHHFNQQQAFDFLLQLCKNYDEVHKHFMQFLMKRRYLEASRVVEVFQQICIEVDEDYRNKLRALKNISPEQDNSIRNSLSTTINATLTSLGMHIVQLTNEFSRAVDYWVLISEVHFSEGLLHAGLLTNEEVAMFHHWLKLMFIEYQKEEDAHDSDAEDVMGPNETRIKTSGELQLTKALLFAKKKKWTMQRAQKLIDRMEKQKWIRIISGNTGRYDLRKSKGKSRNSLVDTKQSVIRLHPSAIAELEPVLQKLHAPKCILCNHIAVVGRLIHTCEHCHSVYHASCMLRSLEFPTKCTKANCIAEIEEEVLEDFDFDPDQLHMPPRRSINQNQNRASTSSMQNLSKSNASARTKTNQQPFFALMRDDA